MKSGLFAMKVPSSWSSRPLGELVDEGSDSGIPSEVPTLPYIGMEHVESGTGRVIALASPSDYKSNSYIANQVLYGRLRPYLNKVFIPDREVYVSREFIPLTPGESLNSKFLLYLLRSSEFVNHAMSLNSGDRPRVKWQQIESCLIPTPPPAEQEEIVRILEEQFSHLDTAAASIAAVRRKADQFRRSLWRSMFSGTQELDRATSHEAFPVVELNQVNHPERPICYGILMPGPDTPGGVPYVKVRDIKNDSISIDSLNRTSIEIEAKYARARLKSGDVLISIRGTYGRVAVVPDELNDGSITQDTARIAPVGCSSEYLANYLRSPDAQAYLQKVARGVAVKGVNIGDLRRMPIPVPSTKEQESIVRFLDFQSMKLSALSTSIWVISQRIESLRRSLLHAAFTGELTKEWREKNDG